MKFYSIFKNETKYSDFINHLRNPEHKRVASKIETGRFTIPKTPKDRRICDRCSLKKMKCTRYFTVTYVMI